MIRLRMLALAATLVLPALVGSAATPARAQADAEALLEAKCGSCHARTAEGELSRVAGERKTPEGWDMTLARMAIVHGVALSADEHRILVKHLADSRGLAPDEARPFRYILERQPGFVEAPPSDELGALCARCHSFARVGLQRRTAEEWLKLAHFHLGQYPTTEYQALGRDRNWWDIVSTTLPQDLATRYPLESAAWTAWRARPALDLTGTWRIVGDRPGSGPFNGTAIIATRGGDRYDIEVAITHADGSQASGRGDAVLYSGYEWRSRVSVDDDDDVLVVHAVEPDGRSMAGRWFLETADAVGGPSLVVREDGQSRVLQVAPAYLKSGTKRQIAIHGVGLAGDVDLGDGVTVTRIVSADARSVVVEAEAAVGAANGAREVTVGAASAEGLFTIYAQVDAVRVEPAVSIARVGGGGGPIPPVPAQFQAVAYTNGPDGAAGTDDDVRIGAMPAAWSVDNANEVAAAMNDAAFAGTIGADGLFMPAAAGPNPQRKYQTNNVGDLAVVARVDDGGRTVEGGGRLIVTVQRWIDPPIR